MELWIRSQDKSCLVNIKAVIMLNKEIRGYYNENPNWFLGKYNTKERALEVLDKIENFIYTEVNIVNSPYETADIEVKSKILCNMIKIFEMPEE